MARESAYGQVDSRLSPDDRLLFLSDVSSKRAANPANCMVHPRRQHQREPADLIAMAAQQFGQEDDITVLSVELVPEPALT